MRALVLLVSLLLPHLGSPSLPASVPRYNDSSFRLPWAAGVERRIVQGNSSVGGDHQGREAYAWDVSMPIGTPLLADRDGVVTMTKDDSNVGGYDYFLGYQANFVVINHGDGLQTLYLHLMYRGVLVRPGQRVVQGQPIGFSGDTGFSGGPHLHVVVEAAGDADRVTQSVSAAFADVSSWGGVPMAGRRYVSGNVPTGTLSRVTPVPSVRKPNVYRNPFAPVQGRQDYAIPHGHFYMQARGEIPNPRSGFLVADDDGIAFNQALDATGGPAVVGYPISQRFPFGGLTTQAFQKLVLQWRPDTGQVQPLNVLDALHDAGGDAELAASHQIPPPADTSGDAGLSWDQVVARHEAFLDASAALKAAYFSAPDPVGLYGLPMSPVTDEGNVLVVRCQRAALQLWKVDLPWAKAGQVTVANGGDLAKEAGLFPSAALVPDPAPIP